MTHDELVAALEALQTRLAALLEQTKQSGVQPLSGGGPGPK
jgi:hypothetical protein